MTTNQDEGYIKFHYEWIPARLPEIKLEELIYWRQKLYQAKLIGSYPNGIGFGNISQRYQDNQFIISASATGNKDVLDASHFSLVDEFNLDKNWLSCIGNLPASSESLSHAAIYSASPQTKAIIHIHNLQLWKKYLNRLPTSDVSAPYGTPEMAYSLQSLILKEKSDPGLIVMGGHEEGILIYASDLKQAGKKALSLI
ncbi:MAG: class II aldolase/adducin family protein [Bacteroidetes bacterium]|nr:MAG: class II aldolase/adducin family protein [Bacteroidota bacterium]